MDKEAIGSHIHATQVTPPVQPKPEQKWVKVPEGIAGLILWAVYSVFFFVLLLPFLWNWQIVTGSLILGHFGSVLNKIKNK